MQDDRYPKVFISYAWSNDDMVLPLAERLVSQGVDVVLDKWELKEGQDKYEFMERCVNDDEITKVLIVCDKNYTEKANSRTGGAGDETVIISSEIYGNARQEKFIPIVTEYDTDGNPYVPRYIKSRIYIDLGDEERYEEEYEKLLRNIYEKPLYKKPKIGKKPEWLEDDTKNLFPLKDLIRQIKGSTNERKQNACIKKFIEEYIETLKTYYMKSPDGKQIYDCYIEMKPIRDIFLDFLPALEETDCVFADVIADTFERMHNTLTCVKGFNPEAISASETEYDIYKIHIWELFICTIVFLRHERDYGSINGILDRTYFLTNSCLDAQVHESNYCRFRHYSHPIEDEYKPTTESKNKFTLLGDTLCSREKIPIYTRETIAEADLFLYQVRKVFDLVEDEYRLQDEWFPLTYIYAHNMPEEWNKMKSRKYCDKMFELFGVSDIEALKNALKNCEYDRNMGYRGYGSAAPTILDCVKLEEIGSIK